MGPTAGPRHRCLLAFLTATNNTPISVNPPGGGRHGVHLLRWLDAPTAFFQQLVHLSRVFCSPGRRRKREDQTGGNVLLVPQTMWLALGEIHCSVRPKNVSFLRKIGRALTFCGGGLTIQYVQGELKHARFSLIARYFAMRRDVSDIGNGGLAVNYQPVEAFVAMLAMAMLHSLDLSQIQPRCLSYSRPPKT